jgi:hypothetical protein
VSVIASGDRINYTLRPAKSVERKVLKDLFHSFHPFGPVSEYRYIGFGSKYFSDFKLFHRSLHIEDMVSIEFDVDRPDKYEFNKPFECVQLKFGKSSDILSTLNYTKKFIAWLDYDYAIDESMLVDINILIENLFSGSLVLVSYNSIAPKLMKLREEFCDLEEKSHSELLRKKLGKSVLTKYIPREIPSQGLARSAVYSSIVRSIFINKIQQSLSDKNSALSESDKWVFSQVAYINYKDGSDMSTLGWVFYQIKDVDKFESCDYSSVEFCGDSETASNIEVPNLTTKEVNFLQEHMPLREGGIDRKKLSPVIYSDQDIYSFSKIYKYFPSFMDVEMA